MLKWQQFQGDMLLLFMPALNYIKFIKIVNYIVPGEGEALGNYGTAAACLSSAC